MLFFFFGFLVFSIDKKRRKKMGEKPRAKVKEKKTGKGGGEVGGVEEGAGGGSGGGGGEAKGSRSRNVGKRGIMCAKLFCFDRVFPRCCTVFLRRFTTPTPTPPSPLSPAHPPPPLPFSHLPHLLLTPHLHTILTFLLHLRASTPLLFAHTRLVSTKAGAWEKGGNNPPPRGYT